MDSFFTKFRNPLVLIAIVLAQVIALAVQVRRPVQGPALGAAPDGRSTALIRRWAVTVVAPIERATQATSQRVQSAWWDYIDLRHVRQQDKQLQDTVTRLRQEQASFAADAAQGRRLQHLLGFKEQYIGSTVAAQVIGTSGSDRSRVIYLDKGSANGLRPEQAVITPQGIVGKLRDVFPHTAQAVLISDASSGAGIVLEPSQIRAILRGTVSGQVQIDNLTADSRIKPGDQVVTSGGDMVYPRGLPVGTIQSIAPDPSHQPYNAITIKPAANLDQLSEVLVITAMATALPPAAQADATQAEITAATNQRAADILAAKLPGLAAKPPGLNAGSTAAATTSAAAGSGTAVVPGQTGTPAAPTASQDAAANALKPVPVLHPDRFSPGAASPAQDLIPGGSARPDAPSAPDPGTAPKTAGSGNPPQAELERN
jgi:rod shape-determining protein MreC